MTEIDNLQEAEKKTSCHETLCMYSNISSRDLNCCLIINNNDL